MADGSRYLRCDLCGAVLDRRPIGDNKDGGVFRYGCESELKAHASTLGWTEPKPNYHLCPAHAYGQASISKRNVVYQQRQPIETKDNTCGVNSLNDPSQKRTQI